MESKPDITIRLGSTMCYLVPEMTRVLGVQLIQTSPGVDQAHLLLQYDSSQSPEPCQVEIPLAQIGRLLHLLEQTAKRNPALAIVLHGTGRPAAG